MDHEEGDDAWYLSLDDELGDDAEDVLLEEEGSWFDVSDLEETVWEYFTKHREEAENYLEEYNQGGFGFLRKRSNSTKEE